jgi:hypothetical protein
VAEVAASAVGDNPAPEPQRHTVVETTFLEALVAQVSEEYGAAREEVRSGAVQILQGFANARIQSFVPILVEKRLRASYRQLRQPLAPEDLVSGLSRRTAAGA